MSRKRKIKRLLIVLTLINLLSIICIIMLYIPRNMFNNKNRCYKMNSDNEYVEVEIVKTGFWTKDPGIPDFNENGILETYSFGGGQTYSVVIKNKKSYQISYWELELTIPENGYINKAWNGEVEISQFGGEYVRLNLMSQDIVTGSLASKTLDGEILIPVTKGDKFKYIPSSIKKEYPINATNSTEEYNSSEVGFIFYYFGNESPRFIDGEITLYLKRNLSSYPIFWVLLILSIILDFGFAFCLGLTFKVSSEEKRINADDKIITESMNTFVDFIDSKDKYTNGHSRRVAQYAMEIAKKIGKSEIEQQYIYRVALMHDCGKIGIPDDILNKNGKLTDEEYEIIKGHTTIGARVLENFTSIPNIALGALCHHERYDGTGYPNGLRGDDIPEVARIISVADSFDAMNSDRCYRCKMSKDKIIDELILKQGTQFDPKFANALLELLNEGIIKID